MGEYINGIYYIDESFWYLVNIWDVLRHYFYKKWDEWIFIDKFTPVKNEQKIKSFLFDEFSKKYPNSCK